MNRHADPPDFGVEQKENEAAGLHFEPEISKGKFFNTNFDVCGNGEKHQYSKNVKVNDIY